MEQAQALGHTIDDLLGDGASLHHVVEHPVGGQAPHEDSVIERPTDIGEMRRALLRHDRLHAEVGMVAQAPVQLDLGLAGAPALLEGGVVQEAEVDGLLELEHARAPQEHDGDVSLRHLDGAASERAPLRRVAQLLDHGEPVGQPELAAGLHLSVRDRGDPRGDDTSR
jgi:hypothetical protein